MGSNLEKTFKALEADIVCECKDFDYPIDDKLVFHSHDGYELILVEGGELALYIEGDAGILKRGDLALMDEFEFHRGQVQTPGVYDRIIINFRNSVISDLSSKKTDLLKCFKSRDESKLNILALTEDEMAKYSECAHDLQNYLSDNKFGSDVLAEAALTQILVLINRINNKEKKFEYQDIMPPIVTAAFNYIEEHISEDLSLQVLERELNYNGTYISRCFKQTLGTSLQKYIIAKRISVAQKLLKNGETPYNVCFMAGFGNYSNFSRAFQKQIGKSPREYRDEVAKN